MKPISIMTIRGIMAGGLAVLGCLAMRAEDMPDPDSFVHNDVKYTIEKQWVNPTALSDLSTKHKDGFANDEQLFQFFVKDGVIYFCAEAYDGFTGTNTTNSQLLAIDAATGNEINVKDIDWNNLKNAEYAAVYCGTDSNHDAYVASYGINKSASGSNAKYENPFEIYVLNLDGENPAVVKKYELPLDVDMYVQRIDVTGALLTGNFTVTASIWDRQHISGSQYKENTSLGFWKFENGELSDAKGLKEYLTIAKTKSVGENLVMVHDGADMKANYDGSENLGSRVRAKNPTIFDVSGDKPVIKSTLEAEEGDDEFGNCFAMLDVDDDHFMLYAHKGNPVAFKMVYLPNFPENFDGAKTVWTYEPGEDFSKAPATYNKERQMTNIFVEKPDEDGTNIYLSANGMGMAKLTLKKDEITTGVENLVVSPAGAAAEYFDIMGRRLADKPASGLYIERRGIEATKHIAR